MHENVLIKMREFQYLCAGTMFLMAANVVDLVLGRPFWIVTRFIYLGCDDNLSAWYSSILLAVAGLLAYECSLCAKRKHIQGGVSFLVFAGLLFFMSGDEVARFHEILGGYAAKYCHISSYDFAKHADWVWVGGPFIVMVFIGYLFLLKKAFSSVSASMYFLGIGFSLIILGGVVLESTTNFLNHGEYQWIWNIEVVAEESLEMMGSLFISYALIRWRDLVLKL